MDKIDDINVSFLQEVQKVGGHAFLVHLCELFCNTSSFRLQQIDEAIQQKDIKLLYQHIHGLRSSCSNLGLTKLGELCHMFEGWIQQENWDAILGNISVLRGEIARIREVLPQVISSIQDAG